MSLLNALAAGQEEMMGKDSPTAVWPQPEQPHNGAERGDDTAVAPLQFVSSMIVDVPLNCACIPQPHNWR
jgi:hypothetical protein